MPDYQTVNTSKKQHKAQDLPLRAERAENWLTKWCMIQLRDEAVQILLFGGDNELGNVHINCFVAQ